jgi:hypothetical protein
MKKYKEQIDIVVNFLFIAALFYITYFALWIVCPC